MGTSSTYGGSSGWGGIQNDTQEWLDDRGMSDASQPVNSSDNAQDTDNNPLSPKLAKAFSSIGGHLNSSTARVSRSRGGTSSGTGSRSGGKGRSIDRAATSGGRVAAGVYGLRTGQANPLSELGLSLDELKGLSKSEQAKRLMEATSKPTGELPEIELQSANAELIIWALEQETEPAPIDLANRWVVEYVWRIWLVEDGLLLGLNTSNGAERHDREQEARALLEAKIAAQGLTTSGQLTSSDFETAIRNCLRSLENIFGENP